MSITKKVEVTMFDHIDCGRRIFVVTGDQPVDNGNIGRLGREVYTWDLREQEVIQLPEDFPYQITGTTPMVFQGIVEIFPNTRVFQLDWKTGVYGRLTQLS